MEGTIESLVREPNYWKNRMQDRAFLLEIIQENSSAEGRGALKRGLKKLRKRKRKQTQF